MKHKIRHYLTIFSIIGCFALASFSAKAADPAPMVMLKSVSQQLLQQLSANQRRIRTDHGLIEDMVRRIVVPHVNVSNMARAVVGRQYWDKASGGQRNQFIKLFQTQVIRTYAAAFSNYEGERVRFYPYRGASVGSGPLQLKSVIISQGQRIKLNYIVAKYGSQWKVTDFIVDGISMVNSYRAQFQATLSEGGLTLLNSKLSSHLR